MDDLITNTTKPTHIGAIILDPKGMNGNYNFMSLETGRELHKRVVKELPITEELIDQIDLLGLQQTQLSIWSGQLLFE